MMISVDTLFQFLNLSMVVGVVVYAIRKYGVSYIQSLMKSESADRKNLNAVYQELQDIRDKITAEAKQQNKMYQQMKKRFAIWQEAVQASKNQIEASVTLRDAKIIESNKRKQESLQRKLVIKNQMPRLLEESVQQLRKEFDQHPLKRKKYISKLVTYLEKVKK